MKNFLWCTFVFFLSLYPLKSYGTYGILNHPFEKVLINGWKIQEDKDPIAAIKPGEPVDIYYRIKSEKSPSIVLLVESIKGNSHEVRAFGLHPQYPSEPFATGCKYLQKLYDHPREMHLIHHGFMDDREIKKYNSFVYLVNRNAPIIHIPLREFRGLISSLFKDNLQTPTQQSHVIDLFYELYAPVISKESLNVFESDRK